MHIKKRKKYRPVEVRKKKRLVLHYWLWTYFALDSDNKFFFRICEKYVVLRTGKNCWAKCFYYYSPNINLPKDEFSRQRFKNISWTLNLSQKIFFLATLTPSLSFIDLSISKYIQVLEFLSYWRLDFFTCLTRLKQDAGYNLIHAAFHTLAMIHMTSLISFVLFYFIIELLSIIMLMINIRKIE